MGLVFFLCCNRQRFGCIEQRPWAKSAEWNTMTWVKLNLTFWNSLWISAGVCIYIYLSLSICRGTCRDLSVEKCNSDSSKVMLPQTLASAPKSQAIVRSSKWHWTVTLEKIWQHITKSNVISSLWFQPGTWNPFFYGHICKSLLSWSLFQATSARRPQRHDEKRCLLVGSTVCKQWSYVAAMSHLILIKWPKRGHNWFSNPLDIFEHVWNWSSPCDEIGSWLWGAHRAAQRHPSSGRRPGAEGWGLLFNDLPSSPEHWSTLGDPSKPYLSARISQRLNGVAICWLMMWDDVGLYSYTIPHIGITRIHDRNSEELKNNSEELRGTWVAPHFALWGTTQYLTLPWSL